jgi:hypothetical protein
LQYLQFLQALQGVEPVQVEEEEARGSSAVPATKKRKARMKIRVAFNVFIGQSSRIEAIKWELGAIGRMLD